MEILPPCFSLLLVGSLVVVIAYAAGDDAIPRNARIGIRTRWSTASDAAWGATHRAFRPCAWVCLGIAVAFVIAIAWTYAVTGFTVPVSILTVCAFGSMVGAILVGLRTAKKAALAA